MEGFSYRQIRQLAGYTQDEVGLECDVDRRTVARFEERKSENAKLKKWYDDVFEKVKSECRNFEV